MLGKAQGVSHVGAPFAMPGEARLMRCRRRRSGWLCAIMLLGVLSLTESATAAVSAWSTQLAVASDYQFRGLSQTNHQPTLQAGLTFTAANGFHAALWGSNVTWLRDASTAAAPISNRIELDADTGWKWPLGKSASIDVGLHRYVYPGRYPVGLTNPDTTEAYLAVQTGDWKLTTWYALGNLFGVAGSRQSTYVDLSWAHDLNGSWSVFAHAGYQQVRGVSVASYADWNAGVTRHLGAHLALTLGYYDSNADPVFYRNAYGHYLGRAEPVLGVAAQW